MSGNKAFGDYERGTPGHVLNAMVEYGIPLHIVEGVHFERNRDSSLSIILNGKIFGKYEYFDGIEQPLFYFQNQAYMVQPIEVGPDGHFQPKFRLNLSVQGTVGFTINGRDATKEFHEFISVKMLTNWMDEAGYKLRTDAGAFFQGGAHDPEGEFIFIEFFKPQGAPAFMDFLNREYPKWLKRIHQEQNQLQTKRKS